MNTSQNSASKPQNVAAVPTTNSDTFNVKDYGATGNGVSDDQPAIMAAINAAINNLGGVVLIPVGTYLVGAPIAINQGNNITLMGTTNSGTVIKPGFSSGNCINVINSYNYTLKNLRLENPGTSNVTAIYCQAGAYTGFIDTFFLNGFNMGIQVDTNINDLTISNGIIVSNSPNSCGIRISADAGPLNNWEQRIDIVQLRGVTINQNGYGTGIYAGQGLNTLRMDNVGLINNHYGFVASSASTLPGPQFIFANDLEIDYSKAQNIYLDKGIQFSGCNLYLQGAEAGCIGINPGFSETSITTSRILPAANQYAIYNQSTSTTVGTSVVYGAIEGPQAVIQSGIICL